MAELTRAQRAAADAMIAGTFDKLGAPPAYMAAPTSVAEMYKGIYPPSTAPAKKYATPAQLSSIGAIPAGSYRSPASQPIIAPGVPRGSAYADTGNKGRASGAMLQQLELAGYAPAGAGGAMVPLPRARPGYAPTSLDIAAMNRPAPANPGMGGAMIGNGIMAPGIPPQGPPPPGVAPTVWAGDQPAQAGAPIMRPANTVQRAMGTNGYVYGRSAGGPWYQQGSNRAPGVSPAQQYEAANLMGQVNALNRQQAARAAGQMTPVEQLQAQGMSAAQAYAAANAGPGSVAAWEQRFAGGTQSGGPAVGGSYGGGASNSGNAFDGFSNIQYRS